MVVQAVKWIGDIDGYLELVDQRRLPGEFVSLQCRDTRFLFDAIKTLAVRGAPAIGVAAAYGLALALQESKAGDSPEKALAELTKAREYLASSRPTAVNLFWALDRMRRKAEGFVEGEAGATVTALREAVLAEAKAIHSEDVEMCRQIGLHGEKFIKEGAGILTHCNAGALATGGQGTALSPMFEAHKKGRKFSVYADETRPLLQGARLTAWELKQAGIQVAVICDNMAGWLMKQGKINAVITGADRIAANGDAANKIGTYSVSILAREHGVPFYIAAPSSTFDLSIASGAEIPIEQRAAEEVTSFAGTRTVPAGVSVWNPAFDVTEARNIAAIITERGVIENPDTEIISQCLAPSSRGS
ncbi:MAG: S-methyl-5-thioribose-1-phosphate isomerase [Phycisphaerales bacterium]|nr:MAG: S-methyl-5-thioribose-1-phosphate isomerase [Phycisphaerales bacterium]